MYVLGYFRDNNVSYIDGITGNKLTGAYFFRLHAINLITGKKNASSTPLYNPFLQLQPGSGAVPNTITIEVPGAGVPKDPGNLGYIYFDPGYQFNRPALLLVGGKVYAAFGSKGDYPPFHGWILAFSAANLNLVGQFCSTPDASYDSSIYKPVQPGNGANDQDDIEIGGSFWQAGWGLAADSDGYVYGVTGNGLFLNPNKDHPHNNYAESLLKFDQNLNLVGSFTPGFPPQFPPQADYLTISQQDTDFDSAGTVIIPLTSDGRKFAVACGKDANVYLVDRNSLTPQMLHQLQAPADTLGLITTPQANRTGGGSGPGVWGGPAYYRGPSGDVIFYCADHGPLQSIQIANGKLKRLQQTNTTAQTETFPNEGGGNSRGNV